MNFNYIPDNNDQLKAIIRRKPTASLSEIRRSLPAFRSASMDHLALRLAQVSRAPGPNALS